MTCSPATTTHPPKALVAVSVGLARPDWAFASAACPILANFIESNSELESMIRSTAAPIAFDRAAEDPNPAAENNPLSISIFNGLPP